MTDRTFSNLEASSGQHAAPTPQGAAGKELSLSDWNSTDSNLSCFEDLAVQRMGLDPAVKRLRQKMRSTELTGGDPDDDVYQASVVGEESVGGQTPTPDQNVTEELQKAVGITALDGETVRTAAKLEWRDQHPWGLNPESAEDYLERLESVRQG